MTDNNEIEDTDLENENTPDNNEIENTETDKYNIRDLVMFAGLQKPIEFKDAFGELMLQKITPAIDAFKVEVSANIFNPSAEETSSQEV